MRIKSIKRQGRYNHHKMKHLLSIKDLSKKEILSIIKKAIQIKKNPKKYKNALYEKVLLTFFELPSLRTEISFDVAMFQMGGEVIDYHSETSPWAKGKESIQDVARVISRYCDAVMMRMRSNEELLKFADNSKIPVINGLTDLEHPCQILGDIMTILEKKKKIKDLKIVYIGDSNNNITHSLMYVSAILGLHLVVICPREREFRPNLNIVYEIARLIKKTKAKIEITHDIYKIKNSDVLYTDSWMSYRIPKSQHTKRIKILMPFKVNSKLMKLAKKDAIFMHCLPAKRGEEVTDEVMDSKQSVVFDQAENRLHIQKAILLKLIK